MQRSLRKWRFGWKRQAGPMPSFGCGAKPPTISCRRGRTKTGSMSNDTGRNPSHEHPVVSSSRLAFHRPFETGHSFLERSLLRPGHACTPRGLLFHRRTSRISWPAGRRHRGTGRRDDRSHMMGSRTRQALGPLAADKRQWSKLPVRVSSVAVSFVAPSQDFRRCNRALFGPFPTQDCPQVVAFCAIMDPRNACDGFGAATDDQVFAGLDASQQCRLVGLGLTDSHAACHNPSILGRRSN